MILVGYRMRCLMGYAYLEGKAAAFRILREDARLQMC